MPAPQGVSPFFSAIPPAGPADRVLTVRATGDLDLAAEARCRGELLDLVKRRDVDWVLLFLGSSVFVDVRGLAVLIEASDSARRLGRRLVVVTPPPCLTRMVDLLGLPGRLSVAAHPWDAAALVLSGDGAT
jgi:anti-anti-sigma factor